MFDLFLPGLIDPISLVAGTPFDLTTVHALGFSSFRIAGIDPAEALDPNDPLAFVTGLGFVDSGQVAVRMVPITTFVAEPPVALLLAISITALACARCAAGRRRGSPVRAAWKRRRGSREEGGLAQLVNRLVKTVAQREV